jgi:hypothetical protein
VVVQLRGVSYVIQVVGEVEERWRGAEERGGQL